MKKTLVAIAALAAFGAQAQSSVQITGYADRGYTDLKSSKAVDSTKTLGSSAGTTRIEFRGTEDVGGGNKVGFFVETDWSELGGASQSSALKTTSQSAGFANGESFVSFATADKGILKLGAVNSLTFANATGVASPAFSTGVGSAYSTKFTTSNGISTGADGYGGQPQLQTTSATAASTGSRSIRTANTVNYVSPAFMGFTAGAAFAAKNNNATANSGNGNTVGSKEYGIRYTQGPIDAAYTSIKYTVGSNGINEYTLTLGAAGTAASTTGTDAVVVANNPLYASAKALAGGLTNTVNTLGATYATPVAGLKLHGGLTTSSSSNDLSKSTATQYGATYTTGAFDLMAQTIKVDDKSTTDADRSNLAFGVNYNFSKTSRLYFRNEHIQYVTNKAVYAGSDIKRTAVGISTSF